MLKKIATIIIAALVFAGSAVFAFANDNGRMFSAGINAGSSFASPVIVTNAFITVPITRGIFIEAGADYGIIHGMADDIEIKDVFYSSWYFYGRVNYYATNGIHSRHGGWFAGIGGGYMMSQYEYLDPITAEDPTNVNNLALDAAFGLYFGTGRHLLRVTYAVRTNFYAVNHRLMAGYTFRIGRFR